MTVELPVPTAVMGTTGRSGSTLLSQILNAVPETRVFAENQATNQAHYFYEEGEIGLSQLRMLQRSAFRLLFKVEPNADVGRIFLKLSNFNMSDIPLLREWFPDIRLLFNTRQPIACVRSYRKITGALSTCLYYKSGLMWKDLFKPGITFLYPGTSMEKELTAKGRTMVQSLANWRPPQPVSEDELNMLFYVGAISCFFHAKPGVWNEALLFEDILKNPADAAARLLKSVGVDVGERPEVLQKALEAAKLDSQVRKASPLLPVLSL